MGTTAAKTLTAWLRDIPIQNGERRLGSCDDKWECEYDNRYTARRPTAAARLAEIGAEGEAIQIIENGWTFRLTAVPVVGRRPRPPMTGIPRAGDLEGKLIVPDDFGEPLEGCASAGNELAARHSRAVGDPYTFAGSTTTIPGPNPANRVKCPTLNVSKCVTERT